MEMLVRFLTACGKAIMNVLLSYDKKQLKEVAEKAVVFKEQAQISNRARRKRRRAIRRQERRDRWEGRKEKWRKKFTSKPKGG